MYATKLERGPGVLPEIVDDGASISVKGDASVLPMGWALSQQEYRERISRWRRKTI